MVASLGQIKGKAWLCGFSFKIMTKQEISKSIHNKAIETKTGQLFFKKKSLEKIANDCGFNIKDLSELGHIAFLNDCIGVAGCTLEAMREPAYYLNYSA